MPRGGFKPAPGLAPRECALEGCTTVFAPYRESHIACTEAHRRKLYAPTSNQLRRDAYRTDPSKKQAENRRMLYKSRYGLTPEEVDARIEEQDGKCAICDNPPSGRGMAARLHVDHDHETGKIRAMLCSNCNAGLGKFRDNPVLLRKAADYVEHHRNLE